MSDFDACTFRLLNCLGHHPRFDDDQVTLNDTMAREPVIINVYDMVNAILLCKILCRNNLFVLFI